MTSKQEISEWFDRGVNGKNSFMIIVCDTFDHDDYPVFFSSKETAKRHADSPGDMQKVMEIYDLNGDKEDQLSQRRAFAF